VLLSLLIFVYLAYYFNNVNFYYIGQPLPDTLQLEPVVNVTNAGNEVANVPDTKHLVTVTPPLILNRDVAQFEQDLPLYEYVEPPLFVIV
jgi:hypothetical protein